MNEPEFILQATFFIVNSFSLCFLVWFVCRTVKHMESKLDDTIRVMRWVKSRHDTTHMYTLHRLLAILTKEGLYEEAAKIKKMIDEELKDLNKEQDIK